jgi:hypothetical protein
MKRLLVVSLALMLVAAVALAAPDQPLRVLAHGAPAASVYVVPQAAAQAGGVGAEEVSLACFRTRFYRGQTPLEMRLPPGSYLVFVMPTTSWALRDATAKAGEYLWDGFACHALVQQAQPGRWRYARGYVVDKQPGELATVLAAFATEEPLPLGTYLPAGLLTRLGLATEEALRELETAGVPGVLQEDILTALRAGHKVLLRHGDARLALHADSPAKIAVQRAAGSGHWAGHRLSICAGQ